MKQQLIKSGIEETKLNLFLTTWGDLWDIELFSLEENIHFINQLV